MQNELCGRLGLVGFVQLQWLEIPHVCCDHSCQWRRHGLHHRCRHHKHSILHGPDQLPDELCGRMGLVGFVQLQWLANRHVCCDHSCQ